MDLEVIKKKTVLSKNGLFLRLVFDFTAHKQQIQRA